MSVFLIVQSATVAPAPSPRARAALLVANMSLHEKLSMLSGSGGGFIPGVQGYTGHINPISRLGIPALNMNDGPQGFRASAAKLAGTSTCWPSGIAIASTWDTTAAEVWGAAMGAEFRAKGANVQLGPGLCVARIPVNGRNFEYISGEDPTLGA